MLKLQRKLKNKKFIKTLSIWVFIAFFSVIFAPALSVVNAETRAERAARIQQSLNAQGTGTQDSTPAYEVTPEPSQGAASSWGGDGEPEGDNNSGSEEPSGGVEDGAGAPTSNDSSIVTISESSDGKKIDVTADGVDGGESRRLSNEERAALENFKAWDKSGISKIRGQLAAECNQDDSIRNSDSDAPMEACIQEKLKYYRNLKERECLDEEDDVLRSVRFAELQLKFDGKVSDDLAFASKEGQQSINDMCADAKDYAKCLEDLKKKRLDDLGAGEEAMKDHSLFGDLLAAKNEAGGWANLIANVDDTGIYGFAGGAAVVGGTIYCVKNPSKCAALVKGPNFSKVRGWTYQELEKMPDVLKEITKSLPKSWSLEESADKTAKIAAEKLYKKGFTGLNISSGKNFATHGDEMMAALDPNERMLMPAIQQYMGLIDNAVLDGLDLYADASMLYKAGSLLYGGAAAVGSALGLAGGVGLAVGGGVLALGAAGAAYGVYDTCNAAYLSYKYPDQFKRDYLDGGISTSADLESAMEEAVDKYEETDCFDYSPPSESGSLRDVKGDSSASSSESTGNIQVDVYRQTGIDIYNDVAD